MGNYSTFWKLYLFKKLNLELVPLFADPITNLVKLHRNVTTLAGRTLVATR